MRSAVTLAMRGNLVIPSDNLRLGTLLQGPQLPISSVIRFVEVVQVVLLQYRIPCIDPRRTAGESRNE